MSFGYEFKKKKREKEKLADRPVYAYTSVCPDKNKTNTVKKFTKLSIK